MCSHRNAEPGAWPPRLLQQAARTNRVTVRFSAFCFQVSLPGVEQRAEKRAGRTKISCSGFLSPALALQGDLCQPGCQPGSQQTPDQRPGCAHTRTLRTCDPLKLQPRCLEKNLWSSPSRNLGPQPGSAAAEARQYRVRAAGGALGPSERAAPQSEPWKNASLEPPHLWNSNNNNNNTDQLKI